MSPPQCRGQKNERKKSSNATGASQHRFVGSGFALCLVRTPAHARGCPLKRRTPRTRLHQTSGQGPPPPDIQAVPSHAFHSLRADPPINQSQRITPFKPDNRRANPITDDGGPADDQRRAGSAGRHLNINHHHPSTAAAAARRDRRRAGGRPRRRAAAMPRGGIAIATKSGSISIPPAGGAARRPSATHNSSGG